MLTGAAASSTSFSLGQDDSLTYSPTHHGALGFISLLEHGQYYMTSSFSQQSILFHHFHFCLIELFSVVCFQEWMALGDTSKLKITTLRGEGVRAMMLILA